MDTLASCYFCGVAVEEPVAEYALLPGDRTTDDATRMTLCRGCARKLDRALSDARASVASIERETADAPPADTTADDPTTAHDRVESSDRTEAGDGATGEAGEEVTTDPGDESAPDEADDDLLFDPVEGSDLSIDDEGGAESSGGSADESQTGSISGDPPGGMDDAGSHSNGSGDPEDVDATDSDDDPAPVDADLTADSDDVDSAETAASDATDADDSTASDEGSKGYSDGQAAGEGTATADGPSMTALEYNKVMRLLQNREFPVDREEFVVVASNAYEISREDCSRVLDAAIDRGLLAETNGQLSRAD